MQITQCVGFFPCDAGPWRAGFHSLCTSCVLDTPRREPGTQDFVTDMILLSLAGLNTVHINRGQCQDLARVTGTRTCAYKVIFFFFKIH